MNLAGWRFVLFALVGTAAIVLLSSIGVPRPKEDAIDRHTGARNSTVRTVAEALAEARLTGNARTALQIIVRRRLQFPSSNVLRRLEARLVAEIDPADAEVAPYHPDAGLIAGERTRALRAREEFTTRARTREVFTPESAVALLARLDADDAIAASTEAFFAPLGHWEIHAEPSAQRPDELTARILAFLETTSPTDDDADLFLAIIRAYRTENRPRARMRWALRAFGSLPRVRAIVDELIASYLARGGVL